MRTRGRSPPPRCTAALCRAIEIDLREALGDRAPPKPLEAVDHQLD